ncbi:hypothetical protein BHE74_00015261 [Ensete ventricosum]|nr:hypothetical protein BHE74_00015261 [Ensete ventricosum]
MNELSCCRYALDVNVERAEDVLTHKKLLELAQEPANRPVFAVRLVQVKASTAFLAALTAHVFKGLISFICRLQCDAVYVCVCVCKVSPVPDGNQAAPSDSSTPGTRDAQSTSTYFRQRPMHEITFSTHDKPKLLSLVNQLLSQLYTCLQYRWVQPVQGSTYRPASRPVPGPLATGRYHRLRLFPPCYRSKSAGNDRFRPSSSAVGRYQPREKEGDGEEEGEEKGEPGDLVSLSLDDPDPSFAGRRSLGESGE